MRFLFGKHHSFKLPCDFEDPGVLKRSSFRRKIRIIPGDPFIAPPISQGFLLFADECSELCHGVCFCVHPAVILGSQVSTPLNNKNEMGWKSDHTWRTTSFRKKSSWRFFVSPFFFGRMIFPQGPKRIKNLNEQSKSWRKTKEKHSKK